MIFLSFSLHGLLLELPGWVFFSHPCPHVWLDLFLLPFGKPSPFQLPSKQPKKCLFPLGLVVLIFPMVKPPVWNWPSGFLFSPVFRAHVRPSPVTGVSPFLSNCFSWFTHPSPGLFPYFELAPPARPGSIAHHHCPPSMFATRLPRLRYLCRGERKSHLIPSTFGFFPFRVLLLQFPTQTCHGVPISPVDLPGLGSPIGVFLFFFRSRRIYRFHDSAGPLLFLVFASLLPNTPCSFLSWVAFVRAFAFCLCPFLVSRIRSPHPAHNDQNLVWTRLTPSSFQVLSFSLMLSCCA